MAARPIWKGLLKVSLVSIPVELMAANNADAKLAFNQLHRVDKGRIRQKRVCEACGEEVPNVDIVKGYEFEKGKYVVVEDKEFEDLAVESTHVIDVQQFVPAAQLDLMSVDNSYWIAPKEDRDKPAYVTMREAMAGRIGIGKLAIYGREYLVAVRPVGSALALHTLHHTAEVRTAADCGVSVEGVLPNPDEVRLARQVIGLYETDLDLNEFTDEYQAGLRALVEAKVRGEQVVAAPAAAPVKTLTAATLMENLKAALAAGKPARKRVAAPKPEPKRAAKPAARKREKVTV